MRLAARRVIAADRAAGRYRSEHAYAPVFAALDRGLYGRSAGVPAEAFARDFRRVRKGLSA
jgi:hypothetical protein